MTRHEMLQQMAAESTGTAAPIHLQGEPMATAPAVDPHSVPGHSLTIHTAGHGGVTNTWAECECGWIGTTRRIVIGGTPASVAARQDAEAHAAQFKAPELVPTEPGPDDLPMAHLRAYAAKRAEWLQAKHDADVARRTLVAARDALDAADQAQEQARQVRLAAVGHVKDCDAAVGNLQGELLALVKGEQ